MMDYESPSASDMPPVRARLLIRRQERKITKVMVRRMRKTPEGREALAQLAFLAEHGVV